jgi:hypothetical protein
MGRILHPSLVFRHRYFEDRRYSYLKIVGTSGIGKVLLLPYTAKTEDARA